MRRKAAWALALAVVIGGPATVRSQTAVYENLNVADFGDLYPAMFEGSQLGDEITLAPGPRQLTTLEIAPGSYIAMSRFDLTVRILEVGVTEPGPEIWSGTFTALESYGGGFVTYELPIPNVTVPDSFVWTVEAEYHPGFDDATAYLNAFGGPTLGTSGPFLWVHDHPSFGPDWVAASAGPCSDCVFNLACRILATGAPTTTTFLRGDANDDGSFDVADPVFLLAALFIPGSPPANCDDAADTNDDGVLDVSDAVYQLSALFVPSAPVPSASCESDLTPDSLDCALATACP